MRKKNLIIIGAGEAGLMIANEYINNEKLYNKYNLIGFLDDYKSGKILDFKILEKIDKAKCIIEEYKIDDVLIAIPSAHNNLISKIINSINGCDVRIKIVPGLSEIIEGDVKIKQIRDFEPSDFLGREEVSFDIKKISGYYRDKTIIVTGGAGSIGSELVKQLLELPITKVVIYGHGENSIHDLIHKINGNKKFDYVIGDITDYNKLKYVLNKFKPDMIFHAAAHKHVPLMEKCPDEALRNNVIGTYNIALLAGEEKVDKFILVSTDKAVNPTSIMGASKRICEKIIISLSQIYSDTFYSLTRFGNVLGSRGSVVPTFKTQIEKGGPVTITDPNMTRFFMSIREAARLVLKSGTMKTGKIFVLDMGKPVKILDLAKNMIRLYGSNLEDIKIEYTGARDGEKLYEEILTDTEFILKTKFDKLFISDEKEIITSSAELNNMIQEIKKAIMSYDHEVIKKVIKKYVPEYQGLVNEH
ncbi:MAG: polysaccharide biosynthesis protein [Spirochaetes bacterium]|nr:polysaccharide biosynthesis protein [Spirochaetota bacterium]